MPKITKFDKPAAERLRTELTAYLAPFLAERGLTVEIGNGKFDQSMLRFVGIEFKVPELAQAKAATNLRTYLQMAGIVVPGDARETFESAQYILVDYKPKAYKRPWVARSKLDGRNYVLEDAAARIHFGTKK